MTDRTIPPASWERIRALFHSVRERPAPERLAFLREHCHDDEAIRREVEALLAADMQAEGFLEGSPGDAMRDRAVATPRLAPGDRLGDFEVLGILGVGGMGEVYRARDTRLGRAVALKVLPATFADDPDRVARFEREAQVLASLNHPNIAHIHGLEASSGVLALVMELVEGPTLADRISHGAVPLQETLGIAREIAAALEAAHENGVIHRDLKPANIKITPAGRVKVLDFGLAKLAARADAGSAAIALGNSPSLTVPTTLEGVILGTAVYMSPEQARGRTVDRRTDIWAFGCIVYETLTARRAFGREDFTETIAAVMTSEPDWTALPRETPQRIRTLLERCLRKDVTRRLRDVGDVTIELEDAGAVADHPAETIPSHRRREWVLGALALVFLLTTLVLALPNTFATIAPDRREARFDLLLPPGASDEFQISPDGRTLAFVAAADGQPMIWIRPLDSLNVRRLPGTERATRIFWSPDSQHLGFLSPPQLKRVAVAGGAPQALCTLPSGYLGASWGTQNVILVGGVPSNGPLLRVAADSGAATPATELDRSRREVIHMQPHFLPDGRHFVYLATTGGFDVTTYVASLESKDRRALEGIATAATYSRTGHLLFQRGPSLMAQRFDVGQLALTGEATPIAQLGPPPLGLAISLPRPYSVSTDGALAYRTRVAAAPVASQLTWFDRAGLKLSTIGPPGDYQDLVLSPDGDYVAFQRGEPADIWVIHVRTGVASRFTSDPSLEGGPVWSPDGRRIVFWSTRGGLPSLYEGPFGTVNEEKPRFQDSVPTFPSDISRDSRYLTFDRGSPHGPSHIWTLPLAGDSRPIQITKTPFTEQAGRVSPDGQWIAYVSNESGEPSFQLFIQSFPEPVVKRQVSTNGVVSPARWSHDGTELFYIAPDLTLMAISVKTAGSTLEAGVPVRLFKAPLSGGIRRREYDVAADGRFLINVAAVEAGAPQTIPITIVLNWKPSPDVTGSH